MNNYEKALNKLVKRQRGHAITIIEEINLLEELVERATPKKPYKYDVESDILRCPSCGNLVVIKGNCCDNNDCRQALDWTE